MDSRILLIEDNADDVLLIKRAFRQIHPSLKLHVLSNGEEAISYLNGEGPHADRKKYPLPELILLDLKIPRKSGMEVLAWLWDQTDLERVRVIVLTSSQCGQDIEQAMGLNAESYLVKPSTYEELVELVKKIDLAQLRNARKSRRDAERQLAGAADA